jgi:hypothetical protein
MWWLLPPIPGGNDVLEYLKQIIARLRSAPPDVPPVRPPEDPDTGVRHPRSGSRPGGSSAIAVAEPDEERSAIPAIGRNVIR